MDIEVLIEQIITYSLVAIFIVAILFIYIRKQKRESKHFEAKIEKAKEHGTHEPMTLHPVIDINSCIKSGACVTACPEKDILGIVNGRATVINASHCIGHGACVNACPVQAISLVIGTEKRGVEIPDIDENFESNVEGVYIAGEMGGMGLIKNAIEQGKQAVHNISRKIEKEHSAQYDLLVVGAGPAGIAATLEARRNNLKSITLEQDTLGGTISSFPRAKVVMTSPVDIPLHGKVKLFETNKQQLLSLWNEILSKNNISIVENSKVESITKQANSFEVITKNGELYTAHKVLLTIGRRGTPRKLNVEGEHLEKVAYRLIEPELIQNSDVLVVGGGDSAIESAMLLADENRVTLSYRGEAFQRIKPKNNEKIRQYQERGTINVYFNSNVTKIIQDKIVLKLADGSEIELENDLVYIFAGGELPTQFLEKIGIKSSMKYGETILRPQ